MNMLAVYLVKLLLVGEIEDKIVHSDVPYIAVGSLILVSRASIMHAKSYSSTFLDCCVDYLMSLAGNLNVITFLYILSLYFIQYQKFSDFEAKSTFQIYIN